MISSRAQWFEQIDCAMQEDFRACRHVFYKALKAGDAYAQQLVEMGFCFEPGDDARVPKFSECLEAIKSGSPTLSGSTTMQPVCTFQHKSTLQMRTVALCDQTSVDLFADPDYEQKNLLLPHEFVSLLADGLFPIGDNVRKHTNQVLACHDMAHVCGFVAEPFYASQIRELFQHIRAVCVHDQRVVAALQDFNSLLSLRLYYLVEVLTVVRDKPLLCRVLGFELSEYTINVHEPAKNTFRQIGKKMHAYLSKKNPIDLAIYMDGVCSNFHRMVNPLGGESRDVFNRRRKQARDVGLYGERVSKFAGNSLYSLYYTAKECLENTRASHGALYKKAIKAYVRLVSALVGTAQLSITDWIEAGMTLQPDNRFAVYQYVDAIFPNKKALFWKAFCSPKFYEK